MKKLTYYPGCSAHGTGEEFYHTLKLVMKTLEVEMNEVKDWNCCGATSAHVMNEELAIKLPLRNLILAEKFDNDIMGISCASCYSRHKTVQHEIKNNKEFTQKFENDINEGSYSGKLEVKSMLQYCYEDIGLEEISSKVKKSLKGLKIASYYGCLLTRPKKITNFDSPEYPMSMDKIMESLGAKAVDFDYKTECCGASFSISKTEAVYELTGRILENAKENGADLICVACPLCQANLDMRQKEIEKIKGVKFNLPIMYFTQLMALAFGLPEKELKFGKHIVPVKSALLKIKTV